MQEPTPLPEPISMLVSEALDIGIKSQPFSLESTSKAPRIRDARLYHSVCPYCAVGCSQDIYVKDGKVIDIEGNLRAQSIVARSVPKVPLLFNTLSTPAV